MRQTPKLVVNICCAALVSAMVFWAGCDTIPQTQNEDAAGLFTGTWPMFSLSDDLDDVDIETDQTELDVVFRFRVNFTFELEIRSDAGELEQRLTGSYVISDNSFIIELDASVVGVGKVPLAFAYEFKGEGAPEDNGPNELYLYTEGETVNSLNLILGSDLEGFVAMKYIITSRLT
jgi:hypothetical protein